MKVHGAWTSWSPWSQCSQTCGIAIKTRYRTCGNPAPAHGGRVCVGPDRNEIYCTTNPPCPQQTPPPRDGQWSEWSNWGECSAPCGGGNITIFNEFFFFFSLMGFCGRKTNPPVALEHIVCFSSQIMTHCCYPIKLNVNKVFI